MNRSFNSMRIEDQQAFLARVDTHPTLKCCDDADRRRALREIAYRIVDNDQHEGVTHVSSATDLINWGDL